MFIYSDGTYPDAIAEVVVATTPQGIVISSLTLLTALLAQIEATHAGRPVTLDTGLELAHAMLRRQTTLGRTVYVIGNGGSAATASHLANDLCKNAGVKAHAFTDPSSLTCLANDYGYAHVYEKPLELFADPGDVLLAISSSGQSENILRAVSAGFAAGMKVLTFSGFAPDNPLRSSGDVNFYVPSHAYGPVEIAHLALGHCLVDTLIERSERV